MAEDADLLALVYDFLLRVDKNLGLIFQKKTKACALPRGSPSLYEVYNYLKSTSKKKLNLKGVSVQKSESDSTSESEDEAPGKEIPKVNGKGPKNSPAPGMGQKKIIIVETKGFQLKKPEESDSSDSDSDEEPKNIIKPTNATPVQSAKLVSNKGKSRSDDSSNEIKAQTKTQIKTPSLKQKPGAQSKKASSSDDSDSDEPSKAPTSQKVKQDSLKNPSSSDESSLAMLDGCVYAMGGSFLPDSVERYDPSTKSWRSLIDPRKMTHEGMFYVTVKTKTTPTQPKKVESSDSSSDEEENLKPQKRKREEEQQEDQSFVKKKFDGRNKYSNFVKGNSSFNSAEEPPEKKRRFSEPFRRIKENEIEVDPRFGNNSFDAKKGAKGCWGEKAAQDLKFTRGKSFRHEKTKK